MPVPDTRKGFQLRLRHSIDGGATYKKACGINTTRLRLSMAVAEAIVQDCGDGDDYPEPEIQRDGTSNDANITGSGLYSKDMESRLMTSHMTKAKDFWEVAFEGGGVITGPFLLSTLEFGGVSSNPEYADVSLELVAAGPYTYTPPAG